MLKFKTGDVMVFNYQDRKGKLSRRTTRVTETGVSNDNVLLVRGVDPQKGHRQFRYDRMSNIEVIRG